MAGLPDETVAKIIKLRRDGFSTREIGKQLGISKSVVANYIKKHQPMGGTAGEPPPAMPIDTPVDKLDVDGTIDVLKMDRPISVDEMNKLARVDTKVWIPYIHRANIWQGFYKLKDQLGHKKVNMFQSRIVYKRLIAEELHDAILKFSREHINPLPKPSLKKREKIRDGYMVAWGLWDAHIGSYGWNEEVGTDWDVSLACKRIFNSVDDMIIELKGYPIKKILMPIGNDFMHFDSVRMKTAFGEHFLDTDTRYAKVYLSGLKCLAYMVERALEICDDIEIMYIPGNHDTTSSFTLAVSLAERFRLDPRVKADLSMNPRKYRLHGGTLLGFDHGAQAKPNQLLLAFSTEARQYWSQSTYREIQIGDKHQRWEKVFEGVVPTNGVLIRRNPSLCNIDSWHHNKALVGEPMKSVEAWRYDKTGYRGSHVTWARDEDNPNVKDERRRK
jgi:hypothetical protein